MQTFLRFLGAMNKNVTQIMTPYIKNDSCRAIMGELCSFYGSNPDDMNACLYLAGGFSFFLEGAFYPKGGSGAFSNALAELFQKRGGKLFLNREVIVMDYDSLKNTIQTVRCKDKSGNLFQIECKTVISSSDITSLVQSLIPKSSLPPKYISNILQRKPSISTIGVYLGINLDLKQYGITNHEIWSAKSIGLKPDALLDAISKFKELQTKEKIDAFFATDNTSIENFDQLFAGNVVTIYSNNDPSCCRTNQSVLSVLMYAEYAPFLNFLDSRTHQKTSEYYTFKYFLGKLTIQHLSRLFNIPTLSQYVEVIEVATPLTFQRYTYNREGALFGWDMNSHQMMLNQIQNRTPIKNLFVCGAWTMPAGGVSAVMTSGETVSKMAVKYLK